MQAGRRLLPSPSVGMKIEHWSEAGGLSGSWFSFPGSLAVFGLKTLHKVFGSTGSEKYG